MRHWGLESLIVSRLQSIIKKELRYTGPFAVKKKVALCNLGNIGVCLYQLSRIGEQ